VITDAVGSASASGAPAGGIGGMGGPRRGPF
jgi:hypothetical protein